MCKIIYLTLETYQEIKKYSDKLFSQGKSLKSHEDQLLDLLLKHVNFVSYRPLNKLYNHLEVIYKIVPESDKIPFNIQEKTLECLRIYCFLNDIKDFDNGIQKLIKLRTEQKENNDLKEAILKLRSDMKFQLLIGVKN